MEQYIEVIKEILPLLDTMEEGAYHVKKQLSTLRYEEALGLLQDMMLGIDSIENAIQPMMDRLKENSIEIIGATLKENVSKIITSYENGQVVTLEEQVEEKILPGFKAWKEEIEITLRPYIIS